MTAIKKMQIYLQSNSTILDAGIKPKSKEPKLKETFQTKVELSIINNNVIDRTLDLMHSLCRFKVKNGVITKIDLVDLD